MTGKLLHSENGWFIRTSDKGIDFPLHPEESKICDMYGDYSIDWIGKLVEFKLIKLEDNICYAVTSNSYDQVLA